MKNNYDEVRKILLAEPTSLADFRSKQKLEYAITNNRIELLLAKPIDGNFDFKHISEIHQKIFGDLYDHAGIPRDFDFSKRISPNRGSYFESYETAPAAFDKFAEEVRQNNFYKDCDQDTFVEKFTQHYADLNHAHPFEEGNGRSLKIFMEYFAKEAGYKIDYPANKTLWNMASYEASPKKFMVFEGRKEPISEPARTEMMKSLFKEALTKLPTKELDGKNQSPAHEYAELSSKLNDEDRTKAELMRRYIDAAYKDNPTQLQAAYGKLNDTIKSGRISEIPSPPDHVQQQSVQVQAPTQSNKDLEK